MSIKKINQYFGGRYMPYWYVAFAVVLGWFLLNLYNNASVHRYILTAYDASGKEVGRMEVTTADMSQPELLPVPKSYTPVKPVSFLK